MAKYLRVLENLAKDNHWLKLADVLDRKYIEKKYNKHLFSENRGICNRSACRQQNTIRGNDK